MPVRNAVRGLTRLVWVVVVTSALGGCGRSQPLSPLITNNARAGGDAPAALSPDGAADSQPATAAQNVDPTLQITLPRPSQLISSTLPPTFTVYFETNDPDARSNRPLEYRYLLLDDPSEIAMFRANPEALRLRDAPTFENWTLLGNPHPEVELSHLTPNKSYLLALVAIDSEGGYNHVFSGVTNMLAFQVAYPQILGPRLKLSGDVSYSTFTGGLLDDPALAPHFQLPMDRASTIQWGALVAPYDAADGTRWALDPTKVGESRPGAGREGGWSGWDLTNAVASVGPFAAPGEHRFYIEARTKIGSLTRLLIILDVVAPLQAGGARSD